MIKQNGGAYMGIVGKVDMINESDHGREVPIATNYNLDSIAFLNRRRPLVLDSEPAVLSDLQENLSQRVCISFGVPNQ